MGKASIPTSPTDVAETSRALYKALTMPLDERRIKAALARQIVERQDLNTWLQRQIADINELLDRLPTRLPTRTSFLESVDSTPVVRVG
jgi:trehalose 6-phosphate synthase